MANVSKEVQKSSSMYTDLSISQNTSTGNVLNVKLKRNQRRKWDEYDTVDYIFLLLTNGYA